MRAERRRGTLWARGKIRPHALAQNLLTLPTGISGGAFPARKNADDGRFPLIFPLAPAEATREKSRAAALSPGDPFGCGQCYLGIRA